MKAGPFSILNKEEQVIFVVTEIVTKGTLLRPLQVIEVKKHK